MSQTAEQTLSAKLMRALIEANGGDLSLRMATAYYAGQTMRAIGKEHGVSATAVHKRIHRLRQAMRDAGVMPTEWETMERC